MRCRASGDASGAMPRVWKCFRKLSVMLPHRFRKASELVPHCFDETPAPSAPTLDHRESRQALTPGRHDGALNRESREVVSRLGDRRGVKPGVPIDGIMVFFCFFGSRRMCFVQTQVSRFEIFIGSIGIQDRLVGWTVGSGSA